MHISLCRCSNDVLAFFHLERNKLFCIITANTGTACTGFLFNILLNVVTMSPKNTLKDDIFMQLTSYKFSLRQLCKCVIFPRAFHFKQMCKIIKTSMDLFVTTKEILHLTLYLLWCVHLIFNESRLTVFKKMVFHLSQGAVLSTPPRELK